MMLWPVPVLAQSRLTAGRQAQGPPTEITVTDRGGVRMHVADMPLSSVLHLLSLQAQRNIIASPGVKGVVTANLYDVTFDEALRAVLMANGAGYRIEGNFVYVYTNEELEEIELAHLPTPLTRVYRLNYISPTDAQSYLAGVVGEDGTISAPPAALSGLRSAAEDGGGQANAAADFIIVNARADIHVKIKAILKQIDIRPQQVLIEATILRAELTDDNALGIDFTLLGGVDLQMLSARSGGIADLTLGQLPEQRFDRTNLAGTTNFRSNVPSGGISVGIIKNNLAVFIRALESVTDTTVLANPKVLALNKQKGQVIVGERQGFITTTVTQTAAVQTVEFLETGTQLIFRPFIGSDGYIRVELHPEVSSGSVVLGIPKEETTEVTTNVILRDGETILIGGLFREVTSDTRSQVPGLGNVPVLGALFKSTNNATRREEVIILLTVHIVKDYRAYGEASREQFQNMERMRVGIRQGLMGLGRDRVAQAHYGHALEALERKDQSKALWHLNMTLHNNARLVPAIKLKERILSERAWDEDGTGGREFLHRLISREKGYALPRFGRPQPAIVAPKKPSPKKPQARINET